MERIKDFAYQIEPAVAEEIDAWADTAAASFGQMIASFSGMAVKSVSSVAAAMPMMILRIVLTIISTFFVSMDFDCIVCFLRKWRRCFIQLRKNHPLPESISAQLLSAFFDDFC